MSEQQAEQSSAESGSLHPEPTVPASSSAPAQPAAASQPETATLASPDLVPGHDAADVTPKVDVSKIDVPKAEAPHIPGKLMIMSSGDHAWDHKENAETRSGPTSGVFGKRRRAALAAVVVLAAIAGALGGALATAGLGQFAGGNSTAGKPALEAAVARIDADIANLRLSIEHTSKVGMGQFNKTSDRLDKVEKAQAEPAAKLAKLSEAIDKLRAAPPAAPVPVAAASVAAKEVTGSVSPPAAAAPAAAPKPEVARLPTVDGWVLRDVANGVALIEGRQGMFEVYAGDPVPGLGRVDAIRRQDGRWVVVTSKGLIVAR